MGHNSLKVLFITVSKNEFNVNRLFDTADMCK